MDKTTIIKGVDYIKAQLEKDQSNRYSLINEWVLPIIRHNLPEGEYHGPVYNIVSDGKGCVLAWLNPYTSTAKNGICDGASCVPDVILGIDFRPGALAHDPFYAELENIASAFKISLSEARKLGDAIFTSINLAENQGKRFSRTIITIYHWGVRFFGGLYHMLRLVAIISVLLCGGCGGCVASSFDCYDYESPSYRHTTTTMQSSCTYSANQDKNSLFSQTTDKN